MGEVSEVLVVGAIFFEVAGRALVAILPSLFVGIIVASCFKILSD